MAEKPQAEAAPQGTLSMEQLAWLVKKLKEPSDIEAAKLAADAKKLEVQKLQMVDLARIETENRRRAQDNCNHKKPNGETSWAGQIHSDGLYHPICLKCNMHGKTQEPPRELLAQGLS